MLQVAFADGGNQTQDACIAIEWAIHYSIASWQLLPGVTGDGRQVSPVVNGRHCPTKNKLMDVDVGHR